MAFSASSVSDLALWVEGQFASADGSNRLQSLPDQANGQAAAFGNTSTSATRAKLYTGGPNGMPYVSFYDASDTTKPKAAVQYGDLGFSQAQYTMFAVVRHTIQLNATERIAYKTSNHLNNGIGLVTANSGSVYRAFAKSETTFGTSSPNVASVGVWTLVRAVWDGFQLRVYQDRVVGTALTGPTSMPADTAPMQLGGQSNSSAIANFNGDIAAFLWYTRGLESFEVVTVESYLADTYGLALGYVKGTASGLSSPAGTLVPPPVPKSMGAQSVKGVGTATSGKLTGLVFVPAQLVSGSSQATASLRSVLAGQTQGQASLSAVATSHVGLGGAGSGLGTLQAAMLPVIGVRGVAVGAGVSTARAIQVWLLSGNAAATSSARAKAGVRRRLSGQSLGSSLDRGAMTRFHIWPVTAHSAGTGRLAAVRMTRFLYLSPQAVVASASARTTAPARLRQMSGSLRANASTDATLRFRPGLPAFPKGRTSAEIAGTALVMTEGDTLPVVEARLVSEDGPIDLRNCQVWLTWYDTKRAVREQRLCDIVGIPTQGRVQYFFTLQDTPTAGVFVAYFVVKRGASGSWHVPNGSPLSFRVVPEFA